MMLKRVLVGLVSAIALMGLVTMLSDWSLAVRIRRGASSRWYGRYVETREFGHVFGDSFLAYSIAVPPPPVIGVVVMLDWAAPNPIWERPTLHGRSAAAGIATLYADPGDRGYDMYLSDSTFAVLDAMIGTVVTTYGIPRDKVILGGHSLAGTLAVGYAEYALAGRSRFGIVPAGVFGLDPPLDFARFWRRCEHDIQVRVSQAAVAECEWTMEVMARVLGGSPDDVPEAYRAGSPYSHDLADGGRAALLRDTPVRLHVEPEIRWQIEHKRRDYSGLNAFDIASMVNRLRLLGNDNAEIVITGTPGVDEVGNMHPHRIVVDERALFRWVRRVLAAER